MRLAGLFLSTCILLSCSGGSSSQRAAADPGTRYRAGDWVTYRYSGSFTAEPVTLTEKVILQQGNHLEIDVVAQRGTEQRHWVQVLTDTPENQKNNVVDELHEVVDGKRVKLENKGNADLYRLYDWTFIMPDGKETDAQTSTAELSFAGSTQRCEQRTSRNTYKGRPVRMQFHRCPDFLWTHGPSRTWVEEPAEDVHVIEVVGFGNEASAKP